MMTMNVEVCNGACPDPGSIPGVSTFFIFQEITFHTSRSTFYGKSMSQTLIIAVLAIVIFYLLIAAKKQRKKSREVKQRVKNRAWRREK